MGTRMACQITFELDNQKQNIFLDTIENNQITSPSTMTSHPIAQGDIIGDHIYRNQRTISINGSFSLKGSSNGSFDNSSAKLSNIESLFERLKNEGIMCSIVKTSMDSPSKSVRFLKRDNMVLTNIVWTEGINSLDFNFTFTEALTDSIKIISVDTSDQYLPEISIPNTLSLTQSLLNWDWVDSVVLQVSQDTGLVTSDFATKMIGASAAFALAGLGIAGIIAGTLTVTGGLIGVIAGAIIIGVYTIYAAIDNAVKARKFREAQFKNYEEDKDRFENFVGTIKTEIINAMEKTITLYSISSNESQECILNIDNEYSIFKFTKNNIKEFELWSHSYKLDIYNTKNERIGGTPNIKTCPKYFTDCNKSNMLFSTKGGTWVYLISVPEKDLEDLTNYYILTSVIDLSQFSSFINEIVQNAITR